MQPCPICLVMCRVHTAGIARQTGAQAVLRCSSRGTRQPHPCRAEHCMSAAARGDMKALPCLYVLSPSCLHDQAAAPKLHCFVRDLPESRHIHHQGASGPWTFRPDLWPRNLACVWDGPDAASDAPGSCKTLARPSSKRQLCWECPQHSARVPAALAAPAFDCWLDLLIDCQRQWSSG